MSFDFIYLPLLLVFLGLFCFPENLIILFFLKPLAVLFIRFAIQGRLSVIVLVNIKLRVGYEDLLYQNFDPEKMRSLVDPQ